MVNAYLHAWLQEAQRQTDDTFQQFMADSMQANWQRAKRRLLDSMLPSGGAGGVAPGLPPNALSQPGGQTQGGTGAQHNYIKVSAAARHVHHSS